MLETPSARHGEAWEIASNIYSNLFCEELSTQKKGGYYFPPKSTATPQPGAIIERILLCILDTIVRF
jgi:hypothetical protein